MRPNLGCYRDHHYPEPTYMDIHSPNIDALAKDGVLFENAFVAHPLCGPSRAAIVTGRQVS